MARLVIELTNRCNLRCRHCFEERHAATGDLSLEIIENVLQQGKDCGIDHLAFFPCVYGLLILHRQWFTGVTFSLDGAREETHDRLRGKGSYRSVMQAASICVVKDLPFTFNMVLTAQNRHEVEEMVSLAKSLGSRGVRFGHLMPTAETAMRGLDLSPQERREVETEIWRLQKTAAVPVGMAPGYFSESPFFPCAPLELEEFNLDYRGNLTLCCHLSGYAGANEGTDIMGNLHEVSLAEACQRFRQRVAIYLADKRDRVSRGDFGDLDHFPCWYCVKYLGKVPGLNKMPQYSWAQA
jgi:MoaA/NifB/PqqE/SkfB family radical SAM enzyme